MRVRVSRVKTSNYFRRLEKWWCETCTVLLSNNSFEWRMWHFRESKHTLIPRKYFQGSWLPNPRSTPLYITVTKNAFYVFLSSTTTDRFVESILFVCLFVWLSVCSLRPWTSEFQTVWSNLDRIFWVNRTHGPRTNLLDLSSLHTMGWKAALRSTWSGDVLPVKSVNNYAAITF